MAASMSEDVRVLRKVRAGSGCWLWTAALDAHGYGACWYRGRVAKAHRAVYEILVGPIPDGLDLDHLCRTRSCVRPSHLEPVSRAENVRRGTNHQRLKTHCPQGHEYTPENTYQLKHGWRTCRTCKNASNRRTKAKGRDVAAWRLR